ncbi:alpha-amylase family glycosyl hydrolase [Cytobacillus sp. FJAT-54145]|uniref:alpha-amylase n=1 Tax=Cytobacillus spartinae TaxID=3299023 RepID=A0ABW6KC22_9BACI
MKNFLVILLLIPFLGFYTSSVEATKKEERKWQDETVYYIMIDRFNNSDFTNDYDVDANDPIAYHGGDFKGIIDQLDYIKDMGFTTIALSPIFDNEEDGYHGYWINDFYNTEEHLGTLESFKQLVKEAHNRDLKVIIDFVVSHVGQTHPWIEDKAKSAWVKGKVTESKNVWVEGLPQLNLENTEVVNYLTEAAKWWITETDIDGYRLEQLENVPADFLNDFSKSVKEEKEDFFILGDKAELQNTEDHITGYYDYELQEPLSKVFSKPDQSLQPVHSLVENYVEKEDNPYLRGVFLDNQHTIRFTRGAVNLNEHPGPRLKMALTNLFTIPGIPIVYYGTEIALDGGLGDDNTKQMNFMTDKELIEYITKIGELRQQLPALTRGTYELLYEKDGMVVYKREVEEETAIVAINNTTKTQTVELTGLLEGNKELRGLLIGDLVRSNGDEYKVILNRDEAEIYVLTDKSGLNIPYLVVMGAVYVAFIGFVILLWRRAKKKRAS